MSGAVYEKSLTPKMVETGRFILSYTRREGVTPTLDDTAKRIETCKEAS